MNDLPPPPPAASTAPALDAKEIADGKVMAVLSYLWFPFWPLALIISIVVLAQKNNNFALYHAKQSLTLGIACLVLTIPVFILTLVMTMVLAALTVRMGGFGMCFGWLFWIAYIVGLIALVVIGVLNVINDRCRPLPIIGRFADKIFGGIKKSTPA